MAGVTEAQLDRERGLRLVRHRYATQRSFVSSEEYVIMLPLPAVEVGDCPRWQPAEDGEARRTATEEIADLQSVFQRPLTSDDLFSFLCRVIRWRELLSSDSCHEDQAQVRRLKGGLANHFKHTIWDNEGWTKLQQHEGDTLLKVWNFPSEFLEGCNCSKASALTLEHIHLSGSVREGTEIVEEGVRSGGDIDMMIQLGPIKVAGSFTQPTNAAGSQESADQPTAKPSQGPVDRPTSMVIRVEETEVPGYVNLRLQDRPACRHWCDRLLGGILGHRSKDWHQAPARGSCLRAFNDICSKSTEVTFLEKFHRWKTMDLVRCVSYETWPCDEFRNRRRRWERPSKALVTRLCDTPAFLVATHHGVRDPPTPGDWRLSFSRQECILLRSLTWQQRACLTLLKDFNECTHHYISSYHLKTALMWVCETRAPDLWSWEKTHESMKAVLDFLLECYGKGCLPCYFFPQINLLCHKDEDHREGLECIASFLRDELPRAAARMVARLFRSPAEQLMRRLLGCDLTEPEFLRRFSPVDEPVDQSFSIRSVHLHSLRWRDDFLRPFAWESLPDRCRQPAWFREHGLDADSSDAEQAAIEDDWLDDVSSPSGQLEGPSPSCPSEWLDDSDQWEAFGPSFRLEVFAPSD